MLVLKSNRAFKISKIMNPVTTLVPIALKLIYAPR